MWTLLFLYSVLIAHGVQVHCQVSTTEPIDVTTNPWETATTAQPSCRHNCGRHMGSCSCSYNCQYYGNCCHDYNYYCEATTQTPETTAQPSCRHNCGRHMGSCSCSYNCQYYGNCCHDYNDYCEATTQTPETTAQPSCRHNCGRHMGSCSCSSSCRLYGNCCHDYNYYCEATTQTPETTAQPSCRHNCGRHMGSCSCSYNCQYYGNCCHDYNDYCEATTQTPETTAQPSCRHNCGRHMGSCSCSSSCRLYGNCCHDYNDYCEATTQTPETTAQPSCRHNCGRHMGSCSCSYNCQYYGNCCHDYNDYCEATTQTPETTAQPSCRHNCGRHMGSCSCSSSCRLYGNCCHDYNYYCEATTQTPETTAQPSCRHNCGRHMGSCSCSYNCQYYGNCCHDYYSYCHSTSAAPTTEKPCGGPLFGSGTFSSPDYPDHYNDNEYCVWNLKAAYDQRVFLAFKYLQLDNCCNCDYVEVFNGPSRYYPSLGKVCNTTLKTFQSSSTDMTVVFRSDSSVVARGFNAQFMSSLKSSTGRVNCFSDKMDVMIDRSYLNSLGYDYHNLYLNDQHCRPTVNGYQVIFSFPIHSCGNVKQFDHGRVVYTNNLRSYNSSFGEITRQSVLKLNITCVMDRDSVSNNVFVIQQPGNSTIIGMGRFNTTMKFYTSSYFSRPVTQVPYEVTINTFLYVQVDLLGRDGSLVIFLDTCVASPSPHDFETRTYDLVRNGCPADSTYYAYVSGTQGYARFGVKTFQFLHASESVYLQCKVLICRASDYNSRCRQGCRRRAARDLGSDHDSQTLVLGPIKLKEPEKKEEGTGQQDQA